MRNAVWDLMVILLTSTPYKKRKIQHHSLVFTKCGAVFLNQAEMGKPLSRKGNNTEPTQTS